MFIKFHAILVIYLIAKSEKRIMIFSFLVFELYFPFAIKDKNKTKVESAMDEGVSNNNNDIEFVELSILMQKELQINIKNQNHNNFQKNIKKDENLQGNLKCYEKYFFFLLKFLMKKDIKNSKSDSFKIEESVYNELKKAILTVDKENSANSKNQVIIIRKNFEFEILDFYYDRQNILQYLINL